MIFNSKFYNVELHTHLDGSFQPNTILEIARRKNQSIPFSNEKELINYLRCDKKTLREFLEPFNLILPIFKDDKEAIWRMTHDFVEKCAQSKTCYVETRLCPQLLTGQKLDCNQVIQTILEALLSCKKEFNVESRLIISGIREQADNMDQLLDMAKHWKPHGVVGIDVAGDEQLSIESGGTHNKLVKIFKEAEKSGIHRTVHSGENGPPESIVEAVFEMHAERLGHGYHVLDDINLYTDLKKKNIHFETCPSTSFMTGAVSKDPLKHPIIKFAQDNVNYSINTDDTMMTGRMLDAELEYASKLFNLSDAEIRRTTLNAAKASFLNDDEKQCLLEHLAKFNIK